MNIQDASDHLKNILEMDVSYGHARIDWRSNDEWMAMGIDNYGDFCCYVSELRRMLVGLVDRMNGSDCEHSAREWSCEREEKWFLEDMRVIREESMARLAAFADV